MTDLKEIENRHISVLLNELVDSIDIKSDIKMNPKRRNNSLG